MIIGRTGYIGRMIEHLDNKNVVLWFGWPSSVAGANNNPKGTWESVNQFAKLVRNLQPNQKLIYASSCSVYDSIPGDQDEECNTFNLKNWYDFAKRTMDSIALLSGKEIYSLRLATVNGYSPCLRIDVMMNKMVEDAKTKGKVTVVNPQVSRPVLGMRDLVNAVTEIVESNEDKRGIYNLASFAHSIEYYGQLVADHYNVPLEIVDGDPTYAWGVKTDKFREAYNFDFMETPQTVLQSLNQEPEKKVVRQ